MNRPLDGFYPITQHFGENPQAYARFGLAGHNGVDYGCPTGTPVLAAFDGVVERAQGDPTGYGLHVKLKHAGGLWTIYGHFSMLYVTTGQVVRAGEVLGLSGNTGNSTGPHLHFEIRVAGQERNGYGGAVDPLSFDPEPLKPGEALVTCQRLNVRDAHGFDGRVIGQLVYGDVVETCGEQVEEDGIIWRPVRMWVAQKYLNEG